MRNQGAAAHTPALLALRILRARNRYSQRSCVQVSGRGGDRKRAVDWLGHRAQGAYWRCYGRVFPSARQSHSGRQLANRLAPDRVQQESGQRPPPNLPPANPHTESVLDR